LVGPEQCRDVHFGAVAAGKTRGNHRHRGKMETFAVFGNANGIVRVERELGGAYTDYSFRRNEKVIVSSPKGLGHAITNVEEDESRVVVIVACSDRAHEDDDDAGQNDYQIWDDL
jgi:dTDP-4-dehydrorhamnose 3,5-epimerase-like enzyme